MTTVTATIIIGAIDKSEKRTSFLYATTVGRVISIGLESLKWTMTRTGNENGPPPILVTA